MTTRVFTLRQAFSHTLPHRLLRGVLLPAICVAAFAFTSVAAPNNASAQTTATQLDSGNKGLFALGILGAELGAVIPAAAGADGDSWWAFLVFPAVGAAGGAVAGHFLLDNNNKFKASVGLLAVGIALIVPTIVLTLHLSAYDPDDDDWETDSAVILRRRQRARAGSGAIRIGEAGVHGGLPGISVADTYSDTERQQYGLSTQREVHLSLVSGAF